MLFARTSKIYIWQFIRQQAGFALLHPSMCNDSLRHFLVSKLGWIKHQERMSLREYKNRESHYYLGRRYLLSGHETDIPPKVLLQNKTYIDLNIRPGTPQKKGTNS
jgi:predicted metal-dependent hydrolase